MKLNFTFLGVLFTMMSFAQTAQNFMDINPGGYPIDAFRSGSNELLATDDYLYFFADDGVHGFELWKSDGTIAGTQLIKDINPGAADGFDPILSDIEGFLFEVGSTIVFMADDGEHGMELWTTDGTEAGTAMLIDIYSGESNGIGLSTSYGAHVMNDILFFQGRNEEFGTELWRTDGTAEGTYMVKNIRYLSADSRPNSFLEFNNLLFFTGDEGWIQGGLGTELYVTDGTEEGTVIVKDIDPGSDSSTPRGLTHAGDFFYFITDDGLGAALWKSNGTEAGTTQVKGGFGFISANMVAAGSNLFFNANDDVNGTELWTSDGTEAGTFLVKDINTGAGGSFPQHFATLNNKAYFIAEAADFSYNLWESDGTEAGTMKVIDGFADYATVFNNEIIFSGSSPAGFGQALWHSDGTAAGSQVVGGFETNIDFSKPKQYTPFQNKLFFVAFDINNSRELWVYEPGGVSKVSNIGNANEYALSPNPANQFITLDFTEFNNKTLNIYNTLGHLVLSEENVNNQTLTIDVSDFQSGIYFTEIINDKNQKLTKRFIVKN